VAVEGRAVGGAEVDDGDAAVGGEGDRAVEAGDVGVVEGDVRVGGAADVDLAAVQEMDAARVGAGDHVELRGGLVDLGAGLGGGAEGEDGAVDEGRLAQGAALGVEPLGTGVQHDLTTGLPAAFRLGGGALADGGGQAGGHGGECRTGGRRDQHVAGRGTSSRLRGRSQRVYDGQPDLHRRLRSLPRGHPRRRGRDCAVPTADFPHRSRSRRPVLEASSHLPLTTRPPPAVK
jgi:hypothetical protein